MVTLELDWRDLVAEVIGLWVGLLVLHLMGTITITGLVPQRLRFDVPAIKARAEGPTARPEPEAAKAPVPAPASQHHQSHQKKAS